MHASGFEDLLKRGQAQAAAADENRRRLDELKGLAHKLAQRQTTEIALRVSAAREKHLELSNRLLAVARHVDALEGRLASYMGMRYVHLKVELDSAVCWRHSRRCRSSTPCTSRACQQLHRLQYLRKCMSSGVYFDQVLHCLPGGSCLVARKQRSLGLWKLLRLSCLIHHQQACSGALMHLQLPAGYEGILA